MIVPTPGELLAGVHRELSERVLPEVSKGVASQQIRAALYVINKVSETWDLQYSYVRADNEDIESTLLELARNSTLSIPEPTAWPGPGISGVSDESLAGAMARNIALSAKLLEFQQAWHVSGLTDPTVSRMLFELHRRMAARAAAASGV